MKSTMKWLTLVMILTLMVGTLLTGCGNNANSNNSDNAANTPKDESTTPEPAEEKPDPVTITYSEWGTGDQLNLAKDLLDAFMVEYPHIEVVLEGKDWGTYWEGLNAAAAGGALPDVYKMSFAFVDKYADLGIMKELDGLIAEHGFNVGDIDKSILAMHQHGGKQMGFPIDANVMVNFYNKDLFDNAATNPKQAKYPSVNPTWEEIKEIAIKMTIDENGKTPLDDGFDKTKIKQWGLAIDPAGQLDTVVEPALWSNGGRLINEDGTLALDTPEARQVIDFFTELTVSGVNINAAQREAMGGNSTLTLNTKKVAMAPGGNWLPASFIDLKYGITQLPSFGGGANNTVVQPAGIALSSTSKNEAAAFTLMAWLAGPEGQKVKAAQKAALPSNSQAKDAYVAAMGAESSIYFDAHKNGILSPYNALKGELVFTLSQQLFQLPFEGQGDMDAAIKEVASSMASFK